MGIIKRKNKKFDYKPRYYKGEGNPYAIKHKFDEFRISTTSNTSLKGKITDAISNLKGEQNIVSINDENYQLDDSHSNSNKAATYSWLHSVGLLVHITSKPEVMASAPAPVP